MNLLPTRNSRIIMFICITIAAIISVAFTCTWQLVLGVGTMYGLFAVQVLSNDSKTTLFKIIYSIAGGLSMGLWGYSLENFTHFDIFTLGTASVIGAMFGSIYGVLGALSSVVFYLPDLFSGEESFNFLHLVVLTTVAVAISSVGGRNLSQVVKETREKGDLNFLLDYNLFIADCESENELAAKTYDSFRGRFGVRTGIVIADQDDSIYLVDLPDNPLRSLSDAMRQNVLNTLAWEAFQNQTALKIEHPASSPLIPTQARDCLHGLSLYAIPMRNLHDMVGILLVYAPMANSIDDYTLDVMRAAASNLGRSITNISLVRRFRTLAMFDELTGVSNRRAFLTRLTQEVARAKRHSQPLGFAILDLDFFKAVNDEFGHQKGDDVLRRATEIALGCMRETDILGRIGGEEFAIVAPGSNAQDTYVIAERIRVALSEYDFGVGRKITLSGGVAAYPDHGSSVDQIFARADQSLYEAKAQHRNLVKIAE